MLTIALISAFLFVIGVLGDCSIQPLYIDIHTRSVEGDLSYGAFINVGSPEQKLSLWPSVELSETTLADEAFCSISSCTASSAHGLYDFSKSSSWRETPPPSPLENSSVLTGSSSLLSDTGTDVLHLLEHFYEDSPPTETNLTSFPLQLLSNYSSVESPFFGPGGLLGLGPSSTLLDGLFNAGKIASRSFGLYLGTAYPRAGGSINGSLTLGGYDAGRLQDPVASFALDFSNSGPSPLKVHVSQLAVPDAADESVAIWSDNGTEIAAFDAYISTSQYELTLPLSLAAPLASALNATLLNASTSGSESTLLIPTTTSRDLTITLSTEPTLSLTIPSQLLSNANTITFSPNGPYILGTSFLARAYLTVSYSSNPAFFLSPAVAAGPFVAPKALCFLANTPAASVPSPLTSTPSLSYFARNGLVGVVVGAGVGGPALCVLAFMVLRGWGRRRARKRVVRFVNLKKGAEGEAVELGDMGTQTQALDIKAGQVRVVEKRLQLERERARREKTEAREWEERRGQQREREREREREAAEYFDPPPRRATVMVVKRESKMTLKGILKLKVPGK